MSDLEVPEPDAVEQAQPVDDVPAFGEADALEQARTEQVDEDEGLR
jgi:hypothetical protein